MRRVAARANMQIARDRGGKARGCLLPPHVHVNSREIDRSPRDSRIRFAISRGHAEKRLCPPVVSGRKYERAKRARARERANRIRNGFLHNPRIFDFLFYFHRNNYCYPKWNFK